MLGLIVAGCVAIGAIMIHARMKAARYRPCNSLGGFWDDDEHRCYFISCDGRAGEVRTSTAKGRPQCYIQM